MFLGAHFVWAFSLMFLFSGRGYWQELIESIVWAHNKLKVAPAIQPRALSIIQGRAVRCPLPPGRNCDHVGLLPRPHSCGRLTSPDLSSNGNEISFVQPGSGPGPDNPPYLVRDRHGSRLREP